MFPGWCVHSRRCGYAFVTREKMAWCSQRGVKAHDGLVGSARGSPSITAVVMPPLEIKVFFLR
jgi:hypothetical protein